MSYSQIRFFVVFLSALLSDAQGDLSCLWPSTAIFTALDNQRSCGFGAEPPPFFFANYFRSLERHWSPHEISRFCTNGDIDVILKKKKKMFMELNISSAFLKTKSREIKH